MSMARPALWLETAPSTVYVEWSDRNAVITTE
jgi:hypothetical protein